MEASIVRTAALLGASASLALAASGPARAQRVNEDVVTSAADAFGASVGRETFGLYSANSVRGFSPQRAGNTRILGLAADLPAFLTRRLVGSSAVKVGLSAIGEPFVAPTGIVDNQLRVPGADDRMTAAAGLHQNFGTFLDADADLRIGPRLAVNLAGGVYRDRAASGTGGFTPVIAGVGRWEPAPTLEIIPYFGQITYTDTEAVPLYITRDGAPPRRIRRLRFAGPDWAILKGPIRNYGLVTRAGDPADWRVELGAFRSEVIFERSFANLLLDIDAAGEGLRRIIADPKRQTGSTSGEVRLSKSFAGARSRHRLVASARGRQSLVQFGGSDVRDFGRQDVEARFQPARPQFSFSPSSESRVRQASLGLGYQGSLAGVVELTTGVQRVVYEKRAFLPSGEAPAARIDRHWLANALVGVRVADGLSLYAGAARGLEENGTAPNDAANRNEPLPALITTQVEAGARIGLPASLTLVAGGFRIEKPFFGRDAANIFREQGRVRHQGLEASLAGSPVRGLTILAGGLLLDPSLSGPDVAAGLIGRRPPGPARATGKLAVDWRPGGDSPLSLDLSADLVGSRVATRDNRVTLPAYATLDLGLRYRFRLSGQPASLRARLGNLGNAAPWAIEGDGVYAVTDPRMLTVLLTVDL